MEKSLPWKCIAWGWMFSGVMSYGVRYSSSDGNMFYLFVFAMGIAALTYFTFLCEVHEK